MQPTNEGLNKDLFEYLLKSIADAPSYKLLSIELVGLAPLRSQFKMEVRPEHANSIGLMQGGILSALADAAMGIAVRTQGVNAATVDISVGFTSAARVGDTLRAEGSVVKAGKDIFFTDCRVHSGDRLIGYSKATFYKVGNIKY